MKVYSHSESSRIGGARCLLIAYILTAGLASPFLLAQSVAPPAANVKSFDPRDLSGVWWVKAPGREALFELGRKNGDLSKCQSCHVSQHTEPEPPLTPWAKEHLILQGGVPHNPGDQTVAPSGMSAQAAKRNNCDPISVPAQLWYTQLNPFEFVMLPDRIYQFFEKQHEWRAIWLNREHPKQVDPSYMGDSIGKWEGNTLVVDTVGFNGKDFLEVGVDHLMSDAFHLVERYHRVSYDKIEDDVTYYDPKAWGEKPWGGLKKEFILQPQMQLIESYCTVEDNARFEEQFIKPTTAPPGK